MGSGSRLCSTWLLVALLGVVAAPAVRATCEQSESKVTCTGTTASYVAPLGATGLKVKVKPNAVVDIGNNPSTPAIRVNSGIAESSGSKVTNRGDVRSGSAAPAISGGDFTTVDNYDTVFSSGSGGVGVDLGANSVLSNERGANIKSVVDKELPPGVGVRSGTDSTITNYGDIRAVGDPGAMAIDLGAGSLLENYGEVRVQKPGGRGVRVTGADATVRNYGTLNTSSGGIAVDFLPSGGGGLLENRVGGVLSNGSDATEISVRGSDFSESIINAGAISHDVVLRGGDDSVTFESTGSFGGAIDGGDGNDTFTLSGSGSNKFEVSSISSFEAFRVEGGEWDVRGKATFSEGIVLSGGRTRVDGTLKLTGDLTQSEGADLRFHASHDGNFDKLRLAGAATLDGTVSARGQVPLGEVVELQLLIAEGGITGDPTLDPPSNSALLDYELLVGSDDVRLRATREREYRDFARSGAQRTIAKALDELFDTGPTGDTADTLSGLDVLDEDSLSIAFERIGPEYYDAHSSTALATGQLFTALLLRRPDVCRFHSQSPAEGATARASCGERSFEPWATGWGGFARRKAENGHIGFDQSGGGMAIGANVPASEHLMLAASVGGGRTHIDVDNRGDGSLSELDFGVGASLRAGILRARGAVSYGHGWNDARRAINVSGIQRHASADYESDRVGGAVALGAEFAWKALRIEPTGAVDVTYLHEDGFDEDGAGSLDLAVSSRDVVQVGVGGGVRLSAEIDASRALRRYTETGPFVFIPELSVGYRAVVEGADRNVDARLEHAPGSVGNLDVEGQDSKGGAEIGVGLAFQPEGGMTMGLGYGLFVGDHTTGHSARLSLRMPFFGP